MITIYTQAIKKLIQDQLTRLIAREYEQSKNPIHNQKLALEQKQILDSLLNAVISFDGTKEDEYNKQSMMALINSASEKVQAKREEHSKIKDEGKTIDVLNNLEKHIDKLYQILNVKKNTVSESFIKNLLDTPYMINPLSEVYLFYTLYHGEQIFEPKNINIQTRVKKEEKLAMRVLAFTQLVTSDSNLAVQQAHASRMFDDLKRDNQDLIEGEKTTLGSLLSKFSFWGIQLNQSFVSEGRLGELINLYRDNIIQMKEEASAALSQ